MQKQTSPAEIVVWSILPALRKSITQRMLSSGLKQKDVAVQLGLTESAVSQYAKNKRASEITFSFSLKKEIDVSLELVNNKKSTMPYQIQRLLNLPEVRKKICEIHHHTNKLPKNCEVCFT